MGFRVWGLGFTENSKVIWKKVRVGGAGLEKSGKTLGKKNTIIFCLCVVCAVTMCWPAVVDCQG